MSIALTTAPAASEGLPVVFGFRPEHILLSDDGVAAEVVVVEPTGSEVQVNARLASGEEVIAVFRERHLFRPGETIRLRPHPDMVHIFDAKSGRRL